MFMSMSSLGGLFWTYIYPIFASLLYKTIDLLPRSSSWYNWKSAHKTSHWTLPEKDPKRKHVLFFCPSLGEYESIVSIISSLKANDPTIFIEVSFFSESGYKPLGQSIKHQADLVSYNPPDTKKLTKEFFRKRRIDQVIISSLALWPTFLDYLHDHHIPYSFVAVSVKSGFSKKLYLSSMSKYLKRADHIIVIDTSDQNNLESISAAYNLIALGDPRVDSIIAHIKSSKTDQITEQFLEQRSLDKNKIIFASTHSEDEELLMPIIHDLIREGHSIIMAPHHPTRAFVIKHKLESKGFASTLHSSFDHEAQVLIIDKVGILKHLYQYCDMAYVGGGFSQGLHNIAEPLFSNCYTIVGPKLANSYIARLLESSKVICVISNPEQLRTALSNHQGDLPITEETKSLLKKHVGSSERIYNKLFQSN